MAVTEAELLRAIEAQPNDDEVRRVYADWLIDRGDPRGEFIQLQCELVRARGKRAGEIRERAQKLVDRRAASWGPFRDNRFHWVFERGFVVAFGHTGIFHWRGLERSSWVRFFPDGFALQIFTGTGGRANIVANWFEKGHRFSKSLSYTLVIDGEQLRVRLAERKGVGVYEGIVDAKSLTIAFAESAPERHVLEGDVADSRAPTTQRGIGRARMMKSLGNVT